MTHGTSCRFMLCICVCGGKDAFSALTLFVGHQEDNPACKKLTGEVLAYLGCPRKEAVCQWWKGKRAHQCKKLSSYSENQSLHERNLNFKFENSQLEL